MTLSVFISVDMEGIAGITTLRQTYRGTDDYVWARELMTEEANAAVSGAFDGGADVVVVSDSHGDMGNLLPHKLDQRADLVQGTPKTPLSMMTGLATGFGVAAFVGYHAGAGTADAVIDHTYTGFFTDVRVNGEPWNETHLNAALAGTFGVPVGLVTGDRACCEQAKDRLPWVRTVAVKDGLGGRVGSTHSPARARASIREQMHDTIRGANDLQVYRPPGPFTLEIDVVNTAVADMCALMPAAERTAPLTLRFSSPDFMQVYRCLLTWMNLGRRVAPTSAIE